jgi:o-succinylbenzoate---CoA ligase
MPADRFLEFPLHRVSFRQIAEAGYPPGISGYERQTLEFCRQWLSGQAEFTVHTSGSTGEPKPIRLSRAQMALSARMTGKALGLQSGDTALVNLHTQYIAGIMMLVRGLELNLRMTVIPPSSAPLQHFPEDTRFDFLSFVPLQLAATLREEPDKPIILNRAKAILVGGAPVDHSLEARLQDIPAPVYQTYGMTETISHVALRRLNGPERAEYYTVLAGVEIGTDERNCLVIRTPVREMQPVVTNDLAEILSPGTFRWIGRFDNVINSGGVKIPAEKVEAAVQRALHQLSVSRRLFVSGVPHPDLGEALVLFIEGEPLNQSTEAAVWQIVRSAGELSRYEFPKGIRYVPVFPETPTGKIDKPRIRLLHP